MTLRHHSSIYGFTDFQELYQSNHGMAGNREAGGFVNSAVSCINSSNSSDILNIPKIENLMLFINDLLLY